VLEFEPAGSGRNGNASEAFASIHHQQGRITLPSVWAYRFATRYLFIHEIAMLAW